jgi:integrase
MNFNGFKSPQVYNLDFGIFTLRLRVSEMLGILLSDIKPLNHHDRIRIHGKGVKERFIEVDKGLVDSARKVFRGRKYLFEKRNAEKPYSRTYVSTMIRRLADSVLHKVVSAHTLRHSWATEALKSTGRIKAVQRQLGHGSSSTTIDLYVHDRFSFEELQAIRSGKPTQDVVSDSKESWRPAKTEEQYDYGELFAMA